MKVTIKIKIKLKSRKQNSGFLSLKKFLLHVVCFHAKETFSVVETFVLESLQIS